MGWTSVAQMGLSWPGGMPPVQVCGRGSAAWDMVRLGSGLQCLLILELMCFCD
jgi:hypothetical protein